MLLPDGFDQHPDARYPLVVNPAHFPTGLNAFSTILPDPTAKGNDKTTQEYAYRFYKEWTSGKLPRMLVMAIQHPTPYYDDSYGVNSVNNGPYGDAITQELDSVHRAEVPGHRPTVGARAHRLFDRRLGSARHADHVSGFLQRHMGGSAEPDRFPRVAPREHLRR